MTHSDRLPWVYAAALLVAMVVWMLASKALLRGPGKSLRAGR